MLRSYNFWVACDAKFCYQLLIGVVLEAKLEISNHLLLSYTW